VSWLADLEAAALARERAGLRREIRPRGEDDGLIDFAGNDYLGLSHHPEVAAAAASALKAYGLGSTASRLVRGSTTVHADLERALAAWLGCEAALVYSSGYLANLGAVRAFAPGPIASDAHNHASLVDGCRLASRDGSRIDIYRHADPAGLGAALEPFPARALVVTESVFSVHGDLAPLAELHRAARAHDAVLLVDEAHAVGVVGPDGAGGMAGADLRGQPDVVVTATLSKALGAAGGFVAGPAPFIRHLVETSRTLIYDTGLPPAVAAGALAALELVRGPFGTHARGVLHDRARAACLRLRAAGLAVREPAAGVLAVPAPGPDEAVAWASACRERGVAVGCFRPPSTPDGQSALRLTVNAGVPAEEFDRALDTIVGLAPHA
jgi:8-amino-7-oxononanoate synthase